MNRKPIVGISMKTYQNNYAQALAYTNSLIHKVGSEKDLDLMYFPSIGLLYSLAQAVNASSLQFGAQNIGTMVNGAQTGEFSLEILKEINGKYVELGHAERINLMNEDYNMIATKLKITLENNLIPVLCIGESTRFEEEEELEKELTRQLKNCLEKSLLMDLNSLIIAYEPIWAIGAKESADPKYIWKSHRIIRKILKKIISEESANNIRIIYGGSVSKETTPNIIASEDVDGVFVGRFGHDPDNFAEIVRIVEGVKNK